MGKKSKNPRKTNKPTPERNPFIRAVDKYLAEAQPREKGLAVDPRACCLHLKPEVAAMARLNDLRKEVKEHQGKRIMDEGSLVATCQLLSGLAVKSRIHDGYYQYVPDMVVATAVDYLLKYDCSSGDLPSSKLVRDLVGVASAVGEVDEKIGMIEPGEQSNIRCSNFVIPIARGCKTMIHQFASCSSR